MVSKFLLDEFEVTVGRFRKFVDNYNKSGTKPKKGAGAHPKIPGSGWQEAWDVELPSTVDDLMNKLKKKGESEAAFCTWSDKAGLKEQHPINCVSWYYAFAFCAWDGGRLPTEAEWEKAAAASGENRLYPWGLEPPGAMHAQHGKNGQGPEAVGRFPKGEGGWGHQDLAGNVFEWVLDAYDAEWYKKVPETCADCANLGTAKEDYRVMRGGGYSNDASYLRAAKRLGNPPSERYGSGGFRCARDL